MEINPGIFRDYDVRGVYPAELSNEAAWRIGNAFAQVLKKHRRPLTAMVARDFRASSDTIRQSLVEGVIAAGADVQDIGVATTPAAYFCMQSQNNIGGGIMITASHNPAKYNGLKFVIPPEGEIGERAGLLEIKQFANKKPLVKKGDDLGSVQVTENQIAQYIKRLHTLVPRVSDITLLLDASGGAAARLLPAVLEAYPISYRPIFFAPDPIFRNHSPNPLDSEIDEQIQKELARGRFHLAAVFDGDGDRVAFFDETGKRIRTDVIFAILAESELVKRRTGNFIFDLTHGSFLPGFIKAHGGKLHITKVGGVHVRKEMKKNQAILGSETSGHTYHGALMNIDSGILTLLRLCKLISENGEPLSKTAASITSTVLKQISFPIDDPGRALQVIERKYKHNVSSRLDGISLQFPAWWGNIRKSNTEPVLRITLEAGSEGEVSKRVKELQEAVKNL